MTVFVILAGAVGGWAGTTSLSGALIAPGQVVVDSNVKKVQHPTGGVVGELRVRDGDRVKGGDIVLRLDQTVTRSNLAIITKGLDELSARKARLSSERDAADAMVFPDPLMSRRSEPDVAQIMDSERKLFDLRKTLQARGIEFRLADTHGEVRDALRRIGFERDYGTLETGQTVDGIISKWQETTS